MQTFSIGKMQYRSFGNTGLKVSIISFGNMINYKAQNYQRDEKLIKKCLANGINHFDTAEIYGDGEAEVALGKMIKNIGVDRETLVIATKIHTANDKDINSIANTNRKHIKESLDHSLKKLQLEYVDIIYAHMFDGVTSVEEICRAFHQVIEEGKAFYWATSNWNAETVFEALAVCERLKLHKPIGAQNQYNMFERKENELEYQSLFTKYKYGLIAWSPLAGGFLTGKYINGINEAQENRFTEKTSFPIELIKSLFYHPYANEKSINSLKELDVLAKELGCKLVNLALAWVIKYPHTSSALVGARNEGQLDQILQTLDILDKFTPELQGKINKILGTSPPARNNFLAWKPYPPVRPVAE